MIKQSSAVMRECAWRWAWEEASAVWYDSKYICKSIGMIDNKEVPDVQDRLLKNFDNIRLANFQYPILSMSDDTTSSVTTDTAECVTIGFCLYDCNCWHSSNNNNFPYWNRISSMQVQLLLRKNIPVPGAYDKKRILLPCQQLCLNMTETTG